MPCALDFGGRLQAGWLLLFGASCQTVCERGLSLVTVRPDPVRMPNGAFRIHIDIREA
jgi:hypothetical protein